MPRGSRGSTTSTPRTPTAAGGASRRSGPGFVAGSTSADHHQDVQPRRLVHREVPPRRAVPGWVADDAAPRSVHGVRERRCDVRPPGAPGRDRAAGRSLAGGAGPRLAAGGPACDSDRRRPGANRSILPRCGRRSSDRRVWRSARRSRGADSRTGRGAGRAVAGGVRRGDGRRAGRRGSRRGAHAAALRDPVRRGGGVHGYDAGLARGRGPRLLAEVALHHARSTRPRSWTARAAGGVLDTMWPRVRELVDAAFSSRSRRPPRPCGCWRRAGTWSPRAPARWRPRRRWRVRREPGRWCASCRAATSTRPSWPRFSREVTRQRGPARGAAVRRRRQIPLGAVVSRPRRISQGAAVS